MAVVVSEATNVDAEAWDAFVAVALRATSYQRWAWQRIYKNEFGLEAYYLIAREEGAICGILPLVRQSNPVQGPYLVSLPFVNYAGLLASGPASTPALLAYAEGLGRAIGARHTELRPMPGADLKLPHTLRKVRASLVLPTRPDELWKQLGSKLRSQIKRPQKEGMTVEEGGVELLDDFYRVLSVKWRDLGSPLFHKGFFDALLRTFGGENRIFVVRYRGTAVAAGWLNCFRSTSEMMWAGTLPRYDRLSPNMLLYWKALASSIERGDAIFDFGRSTADSGTHRFKMQWGSVSEPLPWYYLAAGVASVAGTTEGRAAALLRRAWKRLPLSITQSLGPHLARRLPL